MFYNSLTQSIRQMIDAATGGTLNNKILEQAQELFECMAMSSYQWNPSRAKPNK